MHLFSPKIFPRCTYPYRTQQIDWGFFSEWIDILIPLQAWTATSLWYHLPSIQGASLVSLTYRWVGIESDLFLWQRCETWTFLGTWLPQLGLQLGSWFSLRPPLRQYCAGKAMNPRRFCHGNCQVLLQIAIQVKISFIDLINLINLQDLKIQTWVYLTWKWPSYILRPHDYPDSIPKVVQIWRP